MRSFKVIAIFVAAVVALALLVVAGYWGYQRISADRYQANLQPFYDTPTPFPDGPPGTLVKSETLTGTYELPEGASAYRMMYVTEGVNEDRRVSTGMIFVPSTPAPPEGRKVVAWAHPTAGMGPACAPSRNPEPMGLMTWLPAMLNLGWVVTTTDYAGLGTEGTELYLIGESEAYDVINAVRAARSFEPTQAGTQYGVYGHSQGGHASMWVGTLGPQYAPELDLVGVAGAAPAAPLKDLVDELWNTDIAWVIGSEVFISFPAVYPELSLEAVGTSDALSGYRELAERCLIPGILDGEVRSFFGEKFFAKNPNDDPAWAAAIAEQSAPPTPAEMPVLVVESVNDGVVVPPAIEAMERDWCAAGSTIDVTWLGPLRGTPQATNLQTHMYEGSVGGAVATTWLEQRFAGAPATRSCGQTPPLALTKVD